MQSRIEHVILNNLLIREEYLRKVIPFLKDEYFLDHVDKTLFKHVTEFVEKYNTIPTREAIDISLQNDRNIEESEYAEVLERLGSFHDTSDADQQWLIDQTEKFCKDRAIFNSIAKAVHIIEGKDKHLSPDAIPEILQQALAVSFDTNVGHDYLEDADARHDFYNRAEERIPFDLDLLNKITKGGIPKKTLNVIMAPTGKGKSIFLCHHAANVLSQGKNVLYITLEMSEERIAERIDANLLDISLDNLKDLPKPQYVSGIQKLREQSQGKLIIKEYPTSSAHVGHFRALLSELKIKKNFVPEVIIVDYLNLCASSRLKMSSANVNSYALVKAVAEELRGLAVETDTQMFSATQTNRGGYDNSDIDITDTSESMGLTHTVDFFIALIQDDAMEASDQAMLKQLKNRFGKTNVFRRFMIGLNKDKMKFYDLEWSANKDMVARDMALAEPVEKFSGNGNAKVLKDFSDIVF